MKKTVLILTALCFSFAGIAQTFIDGNFTYTILAPGEVSLAGYDMAGGPEVTIPATVNYDGEPHAVTYIGYQAFMSNELTNVTIPEGVTTIVNGAFLFNSLTTVTIPNSVTHIHAAAFASNEITEVIFGDGLILLGENAFNGNLLTTIENLPAGVTTIEKQTFANNNFTDLVIPNGITAIGEGAFTGNPLSSVTSKNSVPPSIFTAAGIVDSFQEDRSDIDLFVPIGKTAIYTTEPGAQWTGFKSVVEVTFAGISDNKIGVFCNIYPNPVAAEFTIEIEQTISEITITNINGERIETIINPGKMINVSSLLQGVYIVQIQTPQGVFTSKFVKG